MFFHSQTAVTLQGAANNLRLSFWKKLRIDFTIVSLFNTICSSSPHGLGMGVAVPKVHEDNHTKN